MQDIWVRNILKKFANTYQKANVHRLNDQFKALLPFGPCPSGRGYITFNSGAHRCALLTTSDRPFRGMANRAARIYWKHLAHHPAESENLSDHQMRTLWR
jgi:hypothetical protein